MSEEPLQIAEERREVKDKGEMETYTQLNAEFQRIARRDKKAFLNELCKDHELLIVKFRPKLNKVGRTTGPFMHYLNQIPYDYTVEVTNRFKVLDLRECLKNYGWRFATLYRRQ